MVTSLRPVPHLDYCFLCGWERSIADKLCRITVLLEDSSQVVNFVLKFVLCVDDPSSSVVETPHYISLHVDWRIGFEV